MIAYNHASLDVIAVVQHEETVYLAVLVFREGRLRDKKSFAVDYFESVDHVLLEFILSYYQPGDDIPAEVFVDRDFEDREMAAQVVSGRSSRKLVITVPQRGQPLQLVEMARNNAGCSGAGHAGGADRCGRAGAAAGDGPSACLSGGL